MPGSGCSIAFGEGPSDAPPGTAPTLQLVVSDIQAAHKQLKDNGVDGSGVDVQDWGHFLYFADPDGNKWAVQQLTARSTGSGQPRDPEHPVGTRQDGTMTSVTGTALPTAFTVRAVLFDMDGTLVDSTAAVEQVWGEFAARYGLDLAEILRTSHGVQAADTVRRFAPAGADVAALTAELGAMERARTAGIVALPGAAGLLRLLPADAVALVTSADRLLADIRMAAAGLALPATAVTADLVGRGKPHPEGYLRAAELLGVDPADAVVFEDAPAGIAAGLAAGMRTVAVGPNPGELPDGVLRIADYSAVLCEVGVDDAGRSIISFRL
ncbi:Sugar phosphatase YfbT [Arthrobacter sp. ES1]|nr:Sugar phosphatase YfbT [Arthrobacter sp. ES1]